MLIEHAEQRPACDTCGHLSVCSRLPLSPYVRSLFLRRLVCIIALVPVCTFAGATCAYADGGSSIASAPAVPVGQQEFGTISTQDKIPTGSSYCGDIRFRSWWLLPAIAGDTIQILWEAQSSGAMLEIFAPGTTDFNYPNAQPVVNGGLNANFKAELTYQMQQSGNYPLEFVAGSICGEAKTAGPYNFTVNVAHALVVGLPRVAVLHSKGTLTIPVHNPEGGPINNPAVQVELQIKGRGTWQTVGVGSVSNSAALITFKIPARLRRQHVTLRALAHGTGYSSASSAHLKGRTL